MKYNIKTLDDIDVNNMTVLVRVDFNQPIDKKTGTLMSTKRIEAAVGTIRELRDRHAKVVILTHQGSDIEYENFYSTRPHSHVLEGLLGSKVKYVDDVCGPEARKEIKQLEAGDVLMLENVRFMSEEQTLFEQHLMLDFSQQAKTIVVRKLSPLIDFYVNDAFAAAHRNQPSLCGFQQIVPSAMGRLFEKEYTVIKTLISNPKHKSVYVLGGSKINDALDIIETILDHDICDVVLTGGLVGNLFLLAAGFDIGKQSTDFLERKGFIKRLETVKQIYKKYQERIRIPSDVAYVENVLRKEVAVGTNMDNELYVDIGSKTCIEYREEILTASSVFVNGPMGVFENEPSEQGTKEIWDALEITSAFTVLGGGDSITATEKYDKKESIDYICTGGGALIQFISGKSMPVINAFIEGK